VWAGLSEEQSFVNKLSEEGKYIVTFDPLDGSSIIDTNFTVGTIFAVWPKGELTTMTGRDILGGGIALYGSRTSCLIFNNVEDQVDELTLMKEGDKLAWKITEDNLRIRLSGRVFAPGNTRACKGNKGYMECISYWF